MNIVKIKMIVIGEKNKKYKLFKLFKLCIYYILIVFREKKINIIFNHVYK